MPTLIRSFHFKESFFSPVVVTRSKEIFESGTSEELRLLKKLD